MGKERLPHTGWCGAAALKIRGFQRLCRGDGKGALTREGNSDKDVSN